ncbi:hypothetical protein QE152_g13271 [Popillia japonica]|uniref:Uncharacterized protein n=1 Tax=Popillia japonica TaxID=7064 RepID=A0AAW1LES8_POPJA
MVLVGRPIGRAILMPTFIAQPPWPSASLWMKYFGRPIGRAILMPTFIAQPPWPSASLWMKYYGRLFYWKANLTQTFPPPLRPSQGNGYSLSGKMVLFFIGRQT